MLGLYSIFSMKVAGFTSNFLVIGGCPFHSLVRTSGRQRVLVPKIQILCNDVNFRYVPCQPQHLSPEHIAERMEGSMGWDESMDWCVGNNPC